MQPKASSEVIDSQIFPRARTHSIVGAIANIAIVACALYTVFIVGHESLSATYRQGTAMYLGCIVLVIICGISLPLAIRAAFKPDNAIVVDREGVRDKLALNGVIPWENIIGAQQTKPGDDTSSLWIRVRDRNAYYKVPLTKYLGRRGPNEIFLLAWGLKSSNALSDKINSMASAANRKDKA